MRIVIDIPDKEYEEIIDNKLNKSWDMTHYERIIAKGIPLPKGHGRLIDADALNRKDVNCANVPMNFIDTASTIIEADKKGDIYAG